MRVIRASEVKKENHSSCVPYSGDAENECVLFSDIVDCPKVVQGTSRFIMYISIAGLFCAGLLTVLMLAGKVGLIINIFLFN